MQVHIKLCQIAETSTEKTKAIEKLADRVDDFAYDLLDQVKRIEEKELHDEAADRYASLCSEMTAKAIAKGRKKVRYNFYLILNFHYLVHLLYTTCQLFCSLYPIHSFSKE